MAKRKKRLEKQINGIERQIQEHRRKLLEEIGMKDTTPDYWRKEIEEKFKPEKAYRERLLKKQKGKK